jgi:FkbM family methyltransferase
VKYRVKSFLRGFVQRFGFNLTHHIPLARALKANGITAVFDIGANKGQFGSELRRDGYRGKIISFEPMVAAHAALSRRARDDKFWSVHERCAIGAQDASIIINVSKNSGSSSIFPIMAEHTAAAPDSVYIDKETVQQIRLDSVFRKYLAPQERFFLKIDTQGYEKEVMQGAAEALELVTGLQMEISFFELYENQPSYKYFLDWAEKSDFFIWSIHDGFSNLVVSKTLQADICFFRK